MGRSVKPVRVLQHLMSVALLGMAAQVQAQPSRSLCEPGERTVFACEASTKIVSLCAVGDFRNKTGALSYRFGQYGKAPELVVASTPHSVARRFRYHEDLWAKGMGTSVGFKSGPFHYDVRHAQGAFGVDGGPDRAGVSVSRGTKPVAEIVCRVDTAVNRMVEELSGTSLHLEP